MSLFAQRKSTSASSYLGVSVEPTLGVERDLFDALRRLKGTGSPVGVRNFLSSLRPDLGELLKCQDCRGKLAAVFLTLICVLKT